MAALADQLLSSRLVTVTGSSGIGKTRLAVEVAARDQHAYPNGAWLVELAPCTQPVLVAQAVASALDLDSEPGRDPTDAVGAHLAEADPLLILDNCEHLVSACAALVERLLADCPGVQVLATGQQPPGGHRGANGVAEPSVPARRDAWGVSGAGTGTGSSGGGAPRAKVSCWSRSSPPRPEGMGSSRAGVPAGRGARSFPSAPRRSGLAEHLAVRLVPREPMAFLELAMTLAPARRA